jgi:hypothetical protein
VLFVSPGAAVPLHDLPWVGSENRGFEMEKEMEKEQETRVRGEYEDETVL